MKITKKLEAELKQLIETYWDSYAKGDLQKWSSFLPDNYRNIGTTQEEIWNSKEEIVNYTKAVIGQMVGNFEFKRAQFQIIPYDQNIMIHEFGDIYIKMEDNWIFYSKIRMSSLLQKTKTGWQIIHQHGSYPDSKTVEGEAFAFDVIKTENVKLREAVKLRTLELEQKNRELEIETALEKVRTKALAMREPAGMLDVCKTISLQLQSLGVKEIRNVQTAIFYKHLGTYMNYEYYAKHKKTFITETVYTNNEIHKAFATKMLRGKGETFISHIKGDEVKDWLAYQKTTNVFIDKFLEAASSLNYYWFSLGPVALGISTYHPLTEEETNLFKRFLKVFELAYRRYLDIEKAESQTREAQIEAALEKVRAVAMGMAKPEDLLTVCEKLFKELQTLGFSKLRNAIIHILNDEKGFFLDYDYSDFTGGTITNTFYNSHPILNNFLKQIKSANDAFAEVVIDGDQLSDWEEFRRKSGQPDDSRLDNIPALYYYFYSIGIGDVGISTFNPIDENQLEILKRFRNVFELAYRRFIDIQKAEEQAREAQIEAALEKVRAVAMSMNKPDELLNICEVLFKGFNSLGFADLRNAMINIHNDDNKTFLNYDYSDEIGKSVTLLNFNSHPVMEKQINQSRMANDAFSEAVYKGKDLEAWKEFRRKYGEKDDARIDKIKALYYYFYSIGTGTIGISTFSKINEANLILLKRFRNVFSLSYQRYLDIALAEEQAREAKIEAALERVRSKTMGMQKSDELKEVIKIVFQQLTHLKINLDHAGFVVDYTPKGNWHFWIADERDIPSKITHPYFESVWANQFDEAKEKGLDFFTTNLNFEEKNKFYNELLSYVPGLPEASKDFYLSCPGLAATTVLMDNVGLYIENFSGVSYSDEENATLMRFGKVFQQTYTRFLDLQKAEAQAREAKIEAALERTRTQSMIMQHSKELDDTLRVFHEQVLLLGINSAFSFLWLPDEDEGRHIFWAVWEESKNDSTVFQSKAINYPLDRNEPATAQCLVDWKSDEPIHSYAVPPGEVENYFAAWSELFAGVEKLQPEKFSGGLYYVEAYMKFGCFGVMVESELTEDEKKILGRFSIEFERTYTRFLDLQKAEAQARESQIEAALEKVRSKAMAMHSSEDLSETIVAFYHELEFLHITPRRCGVGIVNKETRDVELSSMNSTGQGKSLEIIGRIKLAGHPVLSGVWENWLLQKEYRPVLRGEEINEYYNFLSPQIKYPDYSHDAVQYGYYFFFQEGGTYVWTEEELSEEVLKIYRRFTSVLSLTYKRYTELREAETQAREAKMEASLERVRSKAMAMHSPNDLSETVNVFFKELKTLGIIPIRCGVGQIDGATRTTSLTTTTSSQQGESFQVIGKVKQTGHPVLDGIFDHWKLQKEYHPVLEGEDIKAYYNVMNAQIGYPEYPEGVTQYGNCFFFKEGFVFAWTESKLSEEELQIFRRFTSVLSLTYRRFLDLTEAEEKNKIIQAENDRKTKELEDARQLQLSMLPKELPNLPHLDIAVYMKTATEVGGDYYDFNVDTYGTLTILVGDATGHGMLSGMMVSIMKSFFISNRTNMELKQFFENSNNSIKDMHLGRLMMASMGVQITTEKVIATNAGMPSLLYFRNKSKKAGEFVSNNLPLGGMKGIKYSLKEIKYEKGDTLLLMSDGLAELKNASNEQYGYPRIREEFKSVAHKSSNEIVEYLKSSASLWLNEIELVDDVTLMVVKVK
jgi:hypothetical protein